MKQVGQVFVWHALWKAAQHGRMQHQCQQHCKPSLGMQFESCSSLPHVRQLQVESCVWVVGDTEQQHQQNGGKLTSTVSTLMMMMMLTFSSFFCAFGSSPAAAQ